MSNSEKQFLGFASTDESGVTCFCTYDPSTGVEPPCRKQYNCAEAHVAVTVLPKSRPSDDMTATLRQANSNMKRATKGAHRHTQEIKRGVANLEKSIKRIRFKV
jgi:hypothetical protein